MTDEQLLQQVGALARHEIELLVYRSGVPYISPFAIRYAYYAWLESLGLMRRITELTHPCYEPTQRLRQLAPQLHALIRTLSALEGK
jgi:hypothetical protein